MLCMGCAKTLLEKENDLYFLLKDIFNFRKKAKKEGLILFDNKVYIEKKDRYI